MKEKYRSDEKNHDEFYDKILRHTSYKLLV